VRGHAEDANRRAAVRDEWPWASRSGGNLNGIETRSVRLAADRSSRFRSRPDGQRFEKTGRRFSASPVRSTRKDWRDDAKSLAKQRHSLLEDFAPNVTFEMRSTSLMRRCDMAEIVAGDEPLKRLFRSDGTRVPGRPRGRRPAADRLPHDLLVRFIRVDVIFGVACAGPASRAGDDMLVEASCGLIGAARPSSAHRRLHAVLCGSLPRPIESRSARGGRFAD